MESLKLIQIQNNSVYYTNGEDHVQVTDLYTLADSGLIECFSHDEQDIITHMALDDGYSIAQLNSGEPLLVPNKRQNYIFFFVAVFCLSILMSMFTCIRYIHMGQITLYGTFVFFPLSFACTDIINELYGYQRVRMIIYTTACALVIISGLLALTLRLNGHLASGAPDKPLLTLLENIPLLILINALTLYITDSINAYIFHRIRGYLQGKTLWLRSIISTFIAHFFHSIILMILIIQLGIVSLPMHTVIEVLYSGHLVKMLYAMCSLPLIYGAVHFVKQKEHEHALTYAKHWCKSTRRTEQK